ncbi:unnamed protein product [Arabidopsis thaliana]|uniref:(thale cress) hypothetical protein n=1 Tax=Arabidopsis thaliana TaxID=3702 RepID=A0A7G2ESY4_ARATH|nr:unnamed protein product [Arabidopsis thaliana]
MARVKDSCGEYESTDRVEATEADEIPPSVEEAAEIPQRDEEGAELLTTEEVAGKIQPTNGVATDCDAADLSHSNAVEGDSIEDFSDPNADSCDEKEEATNTDVQHDDAANEDISSILEPDMDERNMLSRVVEKHVDDGIGYIDPIVDSWRERLIVEKKKIFCRSLYQADIDEEVAGKIQPTNGVATDCDAADLSHSNAVEGDSIEDLSDPNADSCDEKEEATNTDVQHDDAANEDISCILEPDMDERNMLSRVVEKHVDDGIGYIDPIVDSWRERLIEEKKKFFCRSLYQADIDGSYGERI